MSRLLVASLVLGSFGCYRSYEIEGDGRDASGRRIDAGTSDADRVDPRPVDAGPPSDAIPPVEDGPPLPPTEPPPGPDERPSDDPGEEPWITPPPEEDFDDCCDGEPIHTVSDDDVTGTPVVAWDGARWLVVWAVGDESAPTVAMRFLDARGRPVGSVRSLPGFVGRPVEVTYGNGRFGLLLQGASRGLLTVLDRELRVRGNHVFEGAAEPRAVVRHPAAGGWVVALVAPPEETRLVGIDDDMRETSSATLPRSSWARLIDFKGRLVAIVDGETYQAHVFVGRLEHVETRSLAPSWFTNEGILATRLRDHVILIGRYAVWEYDPFDGEIATFSSGRDFAPTLDVMGDHPLGSLATCSHPDGDSREGIDNIRYRLFHPGSSENLADVALRTDLGSRVLGCRLGSTGRLGEHVGIWWNTAGDAIESMYIPVVSAERRSALVGR